MNKTTGFLARPLQQTGMPVLVLHAWWGLNADVREYCQALADAGFLVYAPDFYGGQLAQTIDQAETLRDQLNPSSVAQSLADAKALLRAESAMAGTDLALLGFSLGAYFALVDSNNDESVKKVVTYYGTGPQDYQQSKASYLCHFAAMDSFESEEDVNGLKRALTEADRPLACHTYANTEHWFAEPSQQAVYQDAAAQQAWQRTLAFLSDHEL